MIEHLLEEVLDKSRSCRYRLSMNKRIKNLKTSLSLVVMAMLILVNCPSNGSNGNSATGLILRSSVPAEGAIHPSNSRISLSYSEAIVKGTGLITLSTPGASSPIDINVSSSQVDIAGMTAIIDPGSTLTVGAAYTLTFPTGVFKAALGGEVAAAHNLTFTATTMDSSAPTVMSIVPVASATNVNPDPPADIIITFNEAVIKGTGMITFDPMGGTANSIDVSSSQVSIAGAVVTIRLETALEPSRQYTLTISSNTIVDLAGNPAVFNPISFMTGADTGGPMVLSTVPADLAADVNATADIVVTFHEAVIKGTGMITLTPLFGSVISIDVTSEQVTIAGAVVTIRTGTDLESNLQYTLTIPAGAFMDASGNQALITARSFITADTTVPDLRILPVEGSTGVPRNTDILLFSNEQLVKGTGVITITPSSGMPIMVNVASTQVTIRPGLVRIRLGSDLASMVQYSVTIPAGSFADIAGNQAEEATASFTTGENKSVPRLLNTVPANLATDVDPAANIVVTFAEVVQKGIGMITIVPLFGNVIMVDVASPQVTIAGAVVTINPSIDLASNLPYTLVIPSVAFENSEGDSPLATVISFTTR